MASLFSVIIPTYNRAALLGRAIESVLNQTYTDFELLVVDDASTDATAQVVEAFTDDRIVYLPQPHNGGPAATRNAGIRRAQGRLISFLDDDDEFLPSFLAETQRYFESAPAQVGFAGCGIQAIFTGDRQEVARDQVPAPPRFANREAAYLAFLRAIPFSTGWGVTVRAACFQTVDLFDERLRTEQDRDLLIRLARQFDYGVIAQPLVKHYFHGGPHVNVYGPKKVQAYEIMFQKNRDALEQHPQLWAAWHYKIGWLHYHTGNRARGRAFMLRGLRRAPWQLKSWGGFLLYELLGSHAFRLHQTASAFKKRGLRFKQQAG